MSEKFDTKEYVLLDHANPVLIRLEQQNAELLAMLKKLTNVVDALNNARHDGPVLEVVIAVYGAALSAANDAEKLIKKVEGGE